MKALGYLFLCLMPLAIASGGQSDQPVPGKVTLVYFWANWCGPCRVVTPALEKMATADADIALRKIDLSDSAGEYNVTHLPHVKVYNAGGGLVGSVTGTDIDKVKSCVAQAKSD
jgi:thiol-disulfide isomerase/thioredoxin